MINLEKYKKEKYEEYKKEVDVVINRFSDNGDAIEASLNNDDFRKKLGLDSVIDPFAMIMQASVDGGNIRKEIERINKKYGYPGDKVYVESPEQ